MKALPTLGGWEVTVEEAEDIKGEVTLGDSAAFSEKDIKATNSIVHVLGAVILFLTGQELKDKATEPSTKKLMEPDDGMLSIATDPLQPVDDDLGLPTDDDIAVTLSTEEDEKRLPLHSRGRSLSS
mmetsp:Transcript_16803/g.47865  ORF Transcript_16803/g.47865 Transcript_16803/m.47865 type:complete len:126 (+) Transcript_16803:688-1065(+)